MITDTLPNTLHELLAIAIKDLRKVEEDPKYIIDMSVWYRPYEGRCRVCMAGAILASLGQTDTYEMGDLNNTFDRKLQAINALRVGNIPYAYWRLYGVSGEHWWREVNDYAKNRTEFYKDMAKLVEHLKKENI